jgi:hypothetical protein
MPNFYRCGCDNVTTYVWHTWPHTSTHNYGSTRSQSGRTHSYTAAAYLSTLAVLNNAFNGFVSFLKRMPGWYLLLTANSYSPLIIIFSSHSSLYNLCSWKSVVRKRINENLSISVKYLQLISRSRIFLDKLVVTQTVKKLPAFYGALRFIAVLTTADHWFLSLRRLIQLKPFHTTHVISILILSSHLRLHSQNVLLSSCFSSRIFNEFFTCTVHLILMLIFTLKFF